MTIQQIKKEYFGQIDSLDLDLIIAETLKKPREFVLAHPEKTISKNQEIKIKKFIKRRLNNEPLAYILGHKEFYGLNFLVNKHTLIPRPETELLIDLAIEKILKTTNQKLQTNTIDVGTGSGNIITALAKNLKNKNINFFATDISKEALRVARKNISKHKLKNKIKVIHSSLLDFVFQKNFKFNPPAGGKNINLIILANLPYLSKEIYSATAPNVKNFEPKSALLSSNHGLSHYEKLFKQVSNLKKTLFVVRCSLFIEFSPEQKTLLNKLIIETLPEAKINFHKDLAKKWRVAEVQI